MDPERMAELLRAAQAANRRGVPLSRLDEEISKRTEGEFGSVRSLAQAARDSGVSRDRLAPVQTPQAPAAAEREGASLGEKIGGVARLATQGATLGFSDELTGLLAGAGAALVPGGEGFSEARERVTGETRDKLRQSREDLGLLGTAAEIGGAVAAPGAAGFRLASKVPGLLGRTAATGAAGAAEGAVFGAGAANEGDRATAARRNAVIGGLLGAAAPGAVAGAQAVGRGVRAAGRTVKRGAQTARKAGRGFSQLEEVEELERTIGPRLADEIRERAGVQGRPSRVRSEVEEARRGIYGKLDEIEAIEDEPLQKALRSDDVAPFVPEEVAAGKRPPNFPEAQGAVRQMRKQARAALRTGDAASFKSLTNAQREVGRRLGDAVEGFEEANRAFKSQMDRLRALEAGEDLASRSADEIEAAFSKLETDAEKEAFREGLGAWFLRRLDDHVAIPSTLKKFRTGRETRRKLQVLFPDDEAFSEVVNAARRAEDVRETAKSGRLVAREFMRKLLLTLGGGAAVGGGAAAVSGLLN